MKFALEKVRYMPAQLHPSILYASKEFGIAAHLCACGCGTKIRTPLGPTDWTIREAKNGPTLSPSVGNWQEGCKSHYWIRRGQVIWSGKWTQEQIAAGRKREEERGRAYFELRANGYQRLFNRIRNHIADLLQKR